VLPRARLYHRRMWPRSAVLTALAAAALVGCTPPSEVRLRFGQSEAQLAAARTACVPFVQAHPETSIQLAEAACLLAQGFRAPVEMSVGPSRIGQVSIEARGDTASMVRDFQECREAAANAPMPQVSDTAKTGIIGGFIAQAYPRGIFFKAQTSDEWITKSFGACLKGRGYSVSDVRTFERSGGR